MTQDQIKAIAEEVAHLRAFDGGFFPKEKEIREDYEVLLRWLNEKYCIVEREEIFRLYNNAKMLEWDSSRDFNIIGQAAKKVLEELFGTSMFNQDEE